MCIYCGTTIKTTVGTGKNRPDLQGDPNSKSNVLDCCIWNTFWTILE